MAPSSERQSGSPRPLTRTAWHLRDAGGVGLLDSVVALALFLLVTATIGKFVVRQIRAGSTNGMYSVAYALAAQEIEELRGLDYDAIDSRTSALQEGAIEYTIETTVIADSPEPNMKEISVDIAWREPDGAQHVQVQTIYTGIRR